MGMSGGDGTSPYIDLYRSNVCKTDVFGKANVLGKADVIGAMLL